MEILADLGRLGFYKCSRCFPFVCKDHSTYFIDKWNDQASLLLWDDSHFIYSDKTAQSKGEEMHALGLFPFSFTYREIGLQLSPRKCNHGVREWGKLTECFTTCKGNGLLMRNLNKNRLACWRLISYFLKPVNSWDTTMTALHDKVLRFVFSAEGAHVRSCSLWPFRACTQCAVRP